MLQLIKLCKSFHQPDGEIVVLADASFSLDGGCSAALLGESGCGKSTLLHLIAGLDKPDSGEIVLQGRAATQFSDSDWNEVRRSDLSLVFQQFHLISTLTITDNIRFQAALCRRFDPRYEGELIERLGLGDQLDKYPFQLSRGQQQRVAIARAMLHKPRLVLADEPTGNLDEASSLEVMGLFSDLVKRAGSGLLMVTHSQAMAAFMDRRVNLHNGRLAEIE